uniref:TF-B3 domain-containing protein n=1 Tax=Aegilops tauschii TaxID=37682 RepID=M8D8L8_AEGTA
MPYFLVNFTKKYLHHCIDPKLYDLPIKSRDGNPYIKARLIKGVDNRATITRGWAGFFPAANTKEREIYAFAFKCNHKHLRLTVHAL